MKLTSQTSQMLSLLDARTRKHLIWLWLMMLVAAFLETVGLGLFLPLLQAISNPAALAGIPFAGTFLAEQAALDLRGLLLSGCLTLLLFFAFKNLAILTITFIQNSFIQRLCAQVSENLLDHYLHQPYPFFLDRNSANLIRNIKLSTPRAIGKGLMALLQLFLELITATAILTLLLAVQPLATAIVLGALLLTVGIYYLVVRGRVARWGAIILGFEAQTYLWLNQALGSIKEIRISGREGFFTRRFAEPTHARARYDAILITLPYVPRVLIETVAVGGMLAVVAILATQDMHLAEVLPTLGLFAVAAIRLMPAASRAISSLSLLREAGPAIAAVHADFAQPREIPPKATIAPLIFAQEIRCERLSYAYPGGDDVLSEVDLSIAKGETVAVFGASGAGKSTLIDVVLGLLAPSRGRVLIDGADLRTRIQSWQLQIGYVPQQIYLIDDSLRRNVALGVADQDIDDNHVRTALDMAQLSDVVAALPQGLDTVLGEQGTRLSGGQRQRIGIARALYRDPAVLVMDEATSALDAEAEREINRALAELAGARTIIVIAHRLSTVKACQRVIFLKEGRLQATGRFEELAAENDEFKKLIQSH
ncbi:MAG: ABC transporter ATP-binding protein [Alphaproteobacteria bacterium]|nr:ABC transporter ATP-binding protein [Alphaproteobacteria bacterium]